MNIQIDTNSKREILEFLASFDKEAKTILVQSLNKGIDKVGTFAYKKVKDEINLPAKKIKNEIKKYKANKNDLTCYVEGKSKPTGLIHFKPKPSKRSKNYRKGKPVGGHKVKIFNRGGDKVISGSFIGMAKKNDGSGDGISNQLWKRQGKKRLKIFKLVGPRVSVMMYKKEKEIFEFGSNDMIEQMNRGLKRLGFKS